MFCRKTSAATNECCRKSGAGLNDYYRSNAASRNDRRRRIAANGQRYFNATANDESGQQKLSAEYASCLPLPLYGSAALVKVVPPPPAASTLTMLAPPENCGS